MKVGDGKRHLSEEHVPCPWDTTRSPKDLSGEMFEKMKRDVIQYYSGKIDCVLRFNCRVNNGRYRDSD